jgi:Zn-dependent protease/CBS domain-containing protein
MSWSVKLFTVRGIAVRVHASFLLVILWAIYIGLSDYATGPSEWLRGAVFMVVFVLLLFVCVVLHELGHSLVAQLFGVRVQDITLWPIGGVARMAKMPEKPHQEFLISAAGPATNILLALILGAILAFWLGPAQIRGFLNAPWRLGLMIGRTDALSLLFLLTINNLILALFNLVPAFPLDGGRLLRSLLAAFMPFPIATRLASVVGQTVAAVIVVAAVLTANLLLILVGLLIFMGAGQERQIVQANVSLHGLKVRQAMQPIGPRLHPLTTLGEAARTVGMLPQSAFVVVDAGRFVGLVGRNDLLAGLRKGGPLARVTQCLHRNVTQARLDEDLLDVQTRLMDRHAWVAVVVEDGRIAGLVSSADMARVAEVREAGGLLDESRIPQPSLS